MSHHVHQLRNRVLRSLAATGAITVASVGACGGNTESEQEGGGGAAAGSTASGGSASGSGSAGSGGAPSVGGGGTPAGGSGPLCDYGTPERLCLDDQGLKAYVDRQTQLGEPTGPGWPGGDTDANGCPTVDRVSDDCCNGPAAAAERDGDRCCFTFCVGGCCGRPLTVSGVAVVARTAKREDWSGATTVVDADTEIARAWQADALMEHASVASFARFTLQLLALGAPAELVGDSIQAGLDEVDHARRCFALAGRWGADKLGPGKLAAPLEPTGTLEETVVAAFREGCVGETLAAIVAEHQRVMCNDTEVLETLRVIARDEANHSDLAWRFVAWALTQDRAGVLRALRAERAAVRSRSRRAPERAPRSKSWHHAGRLTDHERWNAEDTAIEAVVLPCLDALLASQDGPTVGAPGLRATV